MRRSGFTIVELLIVITVIAILAAITIVAYSNVSQNALAASIQSDLSRAAKQIESYRVSVSSSDNYPPDLNSAGVGNNGSNTFNYYYLNGSRSYCLTSSNGSITYSTSSSSSKPVAGDCTLNGIVGWWKFNGNASDSSIYGNNGVVTNATLTTGQNGLTNGAYNFDGNAYIVAPNTIAYSKFGSSDFSISFWANPGVMSSIRYMLDAKYAGTNSA